MPSNALKSADDLASLLQNDSGCGGSLSRGEWCMLLAEYPQYAGEVAWRKLNEPREKIPGILLPWTELRGSCWARLLAERPEFEKYCDCWEDFDAMDWDWLLCHRPEFADRCDWQIFIDDDVDGSHCLQSILAFQPQLSVYCRRLAELMPLLPE